jgi:pilus assembly protein CpaB
VPGWPRTARDPGWAPLRRHHPGRRRLAAAGLAAGSVAAALQVLAPRPPAGEPVVVAAREVPAGAVLAPADLAVVRRPPSLLPSGAVADRSAAVGRTVGSGLRPGEPLTDARLVGPGLLVGRPLGDVAAPVRIADGEAAALLRAGDQVDVLQAFGADAGVGVGSGGDGSGGGGSGGGGSGERSARAEGDGASLPRARTVVRRATVLARPGLPAGGGLLPEADPSAGGLIVLAVDERAAAALAEAAALGPLSLVVRPGS